MRPLVCETDLPAAWADAFLESHAGGGAALG